MDCSYYGFFFFFSSRRRHTRFKCDWSSDVCSSDLTGQSRVRGQSCHRALATGYTFSLYNYPRGDQNQQYLITGLSYHLKENPRVSAVAPGAKRSEERRVGKECRSRWSPYH